MSPRGRFLWQLVEAKASLFIIFHHTFRRGHTQKLFPWEEKQKDKASTEHLTAL